MRQLKSWRSSGGLVVLMMIVIFMDTGGEAMVVRGKSLPFEDCGSRYELISIEISSCKYSPCRIPVGETVTVTAEFDITGNYQTTSVVLSHNAEWEINNVITKATVTPDLCDGLTCPQTTDYGLVFTAKLIVSKSLPTLRGRLIWRVTNDHDEIVMCYQIPISLTT